MSWNCDKERSRKACGRPIESHEIQFLEKLGSALKQIRERQNFTQRRLSRVSGFSQGYLSNIENGIRRTRRSTLEKLLNSLGATHYALDDLCDLAGPSLAEESKFRRDTNDKD